MQNVTAPGGAIHKTEGSRVQTKLQRWQDTLSPFVMNADRLVSFLTSINWFVSEIETRQGCTPNMFVNVSYILFVCLVLCAIGWVLYRRWYGSSWGRIAES